MAAAYLNLKKIKGHRGTLIAARHNLREIQAELGADSHIDSARTGLNLILEGPPTAAEVAEMATQAIEDAGPRLRKDTVLAVEVVVSLPPHSAIQIRAFFTEALAWMRNAFGVPVLSAVVHLDEEAPHMHALLLPLKDGKMNGSDLMGSPKRLSALQVDFHARVASRHGLGRQREGRRISAAIKTKAAQAALDCLRKVPAKLCLPDVLYALEQAITRMPDPSTLLTALGLDMPTAKTKNGTFAGVMTKAVKPEPKSKPYRVSHYSDGLPAAA